MNEIKNEGKVYLIGAGPGDPGLLTIKACEILKKCDIVIYDALLNSEIVNFVPPHAERIYIGKSRHEARISQEEVENIMVERARQGETVVRLKGGDPFIFGRGGEEAEKLTEAGIEWEVVPGVSSGIAAPAYAAIPLTHRDCASSVTFITGHKCKSGPQIDWRKIRHDCNTLVIFMGVFKLNDIVGQLLQSNYEPDVAVAIVESGTTPQQKIRTGTLGTIREMAEKDPVSTPALIIIGNVVRYREKLLEHLSMTVAESATMDQEA